MSSTPKHMRKESSLLLPSYYSTILLFFLLFYILSEVSSEWIDSLYRKQPETLTYPRNAKTRAIFRKPFLFVGYAILFLFCLDSPLPVLIDRLLLIYFLLLTICTDFEQYVIFDRILLPFGLLAFPMMALLGLPWMDHLLAALIGGAVFLLLAILTRGGIGGGDIKLIFVLGLWLGSRTLLGTVILGFCLGGVAALFFLLSKQKKRKEFFAYGPYFSIAALLLSLK